MEKALDRLMTRFAGVGLVGVALAAVVFASADAGAWDADLDLTFSDDGLRVLSNGNSEIKGVAVQPDAKIVVVGISSMNPTSTPFVYQDDFVIARLDAAGELDPTFGTNGVTQIDVGAGEFDDHALDVAVQVDGKIVVVGTIVDTESMVNVNVPGTDLPNCLLMGPRRQRIRAVLPRMRTPDPSRAG